MAIVDLSGQRIGRWEVLYLLEERTKKRGTIWHCRCECGTEKDVPGEALRNGSSKSCGCLQKEVASQLGKNTAIDFSGQRFGKLVALERIPSKDRNKHTKWKCVCDCGNMVDIDLGNLMAGKSKSCGCTLSHNEEHIIRLLQENNIDFEYQYEFDDLPNKPFDFYVNNKYIIEFDGQQHFLYTKYGWAGKEKLIRTHKNDLIKNQYCFDNNIPIIRIPYNKDYTFEDLIIDTTHFLFYKDLEKQYYGLDQDIEVECDRNNIRFDNPIKNTSGYPGVYFHKRSQKWKAFITCNGQNIHLGTFNMKEEAAIARLNAEIQYIGHPKYKIYEALQYKINERK